MGHKNKESLTYQINNALNAKACFGESRHQAKIQGKAQDGIYSYNTFKTYMKASNRFADYCKENYKCKTLDQCKEHVNDYIQSRRSDGVSAYTQKMEVAALGKLYGESFYKSVETDSRHRSDITRSRMDTARGRHFSEEKNKELVNFCRNTGLRRSELENITGKNLIMKEDGNYYIHVDNGKGGKERDVYILNQDKGVIEKMASAESDEKVWGRVHNGCDVHGYRAEYATEYYNSIARDVAELERCERYDCRADLVGKSYDRDAMLEVSKALGHNRIDVIAQAYLRK